MASPVIDERESAADQSPWKRLLSGTLPLQNETTWFVLVSTLDVFATYLLLRYSAQADARVRFVESNPVARYFLYAWGMRGMVYFKFAAVAVVVVVAQLIAVKKEHVARRLLQSAIVLVGAVVAYSTWLFVRALAAG